MPTFRLVTALAKYGSRKIKPKRRNGGTQALREEAAKSGAGGRNWTDVCPFNSVGWLTQHELGTFCRPFSPWVLSQASKSLSHASDLGSIHIARSINLVDSVALPLLRLENGANWPEFWTQVGPKIRSYRLRRRSPTVSRLPHPLGAEGLEL